jgi:hypothetical protein
MPSRPWTLKLTLRPKLGKRRIRLPRDTRLKGKERRGEARRGEERRGEERKGNGMAHAWSCCVTASKAWRDEGETNRMESCRCLSFVSCLVSSLILVLERRSLALSCLVLSCPCPCLLVSSRELGLSLTQQPWRMNRLPDGIIAGGECAKAHHLQAKRPPQRGVE